MKLLAKAASKLGIGRPDGPIVPSVQKLGYDATEDDGRRKASFGPLVGEDRVLTAGKRKKLVGNSRDLVRNFAIAAWAIRKHLDYVSSFTFQATNDDDKFNNKLELLMSEFCHRSRCDVANRHPLRRIIRLGEARRTVDGDFFLIKLALGQLQAIEADRVRNDAGRQEDWINGVKVNNYGRALAYRIFDSSQKLTNSTSRTIQASRVIHHAYYDRFDQYRGISPLASGLNSLRDVYENFNYALAKAKVSQLFGLVTKRAGEDPLGTIDGNEDDEEGATDELTVDFGSGPFHLDLDIEEDATILESKVPATEFQNFTQSMIMVSLKAIDLPYSFYDEKWTNFYGSRGGLIQYIKSCKSKREDNQDVLTEITRWQFVLWILDGRLKLPSGMTIYDIKFQWIPDGVPWWDPVKEVTGHRSAIEAAFSCPQEVCRQVGTDFHDNVDRIAEAMSYAKERGVPLSFSSDVVKDVSNAS